MELAEGEVAIHGSRLIPVLGRAPGNLQEAVPVPGFVLPTRRRARYAGIGEEVDVVDGHVPERGEDRQRPLVAAAAHVRILLKAAERLEVKLVARDERRQVEQLVLGVELDE